MSVELLARRASLTGPGCRIAAVGKPARLFLRLSGDMAHTTGEEVVVGVRVSLPGAARQGDMASRNTVLPTLLSYEEHAILAGAGDAAGHLLVPLYYRVRRAGTIFLEVTVNGEMVRGCPLSVLVQAGTACAQTSEIAPDLRPRSRLVVTAGELARFSLVLRDEYGNFTDDRSRLVVVLVDADSRASHPRGATLSAGLIGASDCDSARRPAPLLLPCAVLPVAPATHRRGGRGSPHGTVECSFTQNVAGMFEVMATVNGCKLGGPCLLCEVRPGPPSAQHSTVSGSGTSFAVAGEPAEFMIVAIDACGNSRSRGGDSWLAWLVPPHDPSDTGSRPMPFRRDRGVRLKVRDEKDGTYRCVYVAPRAGPFELHIGQLTRHCGGGSGSPGTATAGSWDTWDSRPAPAWVRPIAGSPFSLLVAEAVAEADRGRPSPTSTADDAKMRARGSMSRSGRREDVQQTLRHEVTARLASVRASATLAVPDFVIRGVGASRAVCGEEAWFEVAPRNGAEMRDVDEGRLAVVIEQAGTGAASVPNIRAVGGGFAVHYTPQIAGAYEGWIQFDGRVIDACPLRIAAVPAQADPSACTLKITDTFDAHPSAAWVGPGEGGGFNPDGRPSLSCNAGQDVTALLMPRDRLGNAVPPFLAVAARGGRPPDVSLAFLHPDGGAVEYGAAKLLHGETYELRWRLVRAGRFDAVVSLADGTAGGVPIARFELHVAPGAPNAVLPVSGTRMGEETFEAGQRVSVQFEVCDEHGNACQGEDMATESSVLGGYIFPLPYLACTACVAEDAPLLRPIGPGAYELTMRLILVGEHRLRSALSEACAAFSDLAFTVNPGPVCPSQCVIHAPKRVQTYQRHQLCVELRDQFGNLCPTGCPLQVRIAPRSHGRRGRLASPVHHANGVSKVDMILDASGVYQVSVLVGRKHVASSPFVIHASVHCWGSADDGVVAN